MRIMKIFFISIIITVFGIFYAMSKATDSIVGSVEGMICIDCQKKLIKAFQDELGKEHDIKVIVSWEDGLGSITFPESSNIDEETFKKIVTESGFKVNDVVRKKIPVKNLSQEIKQARIDHKLATTALVSIMQSKDISGLQLNNNSRLIYSTKTIKSPLSKKVLLTGLAEYFEDEDELKKAIENILNKRSEKTMDKIERK